MKRAVSLMEHRGTERELCSVSDSSSWRMRAAENWQKRAAEARAKAETLRDVGANAIMLQVAAMYDHLAKLAKGENGSN